MREPHDHTIVFIGPENSGKTTISKLVSSALARERFELDRYRDELYAPYNYDKDKANKIYEDKGVWAFYEHWKYFEFKAVQSILSSLKQPESRYHGKILDFGAGHSVYEDPDQLAPISELMKPIKHVFLVIPCQDPEIALKVTEERQGHALELNKHFLEHESNALLAKHIIYTKDATPQECAQQVIDIVTRLK